MKKDALLSPVRIPSDMKTEFYVALDYYGLSRPDFTRYCITCLINKYRKGEQLEIHYGPDGSVFRALPRSV